MTDELPRRPFDHHVEPLFAGLGVEEARPPRASGRRALALSVLVALGASALILWWMA